MALGAAIAVSFLLLECGLVFGWPAWLYGSRVRTARYAAGRWHLGPGLVTILVLSAAGFGIAIAALHLRDLGQ